MPALKPAATAPAALGPTRLVSPVVVVQIVTGLLALAIVWLSLDFARQDREARAAGVRQRLGALATVAADGIARGLFGARDTLRLLSRLPMMRQVRRTGWLSDRLAALETWTAELPERCETGWQTWRELTHALRQDLRLTVDVGLAGLRRWFYDLGLLTAAEPWLDDLDGRLGGWLTGRAGNRGLGSSSVFDFGGSTRRGELALGEGLAEAMRSLLAGLAVPARLLDAALVPGPLQPADLTEINRVLAVSLSDRDLIRSLTVRDLRGRRLAGVTEIGDEIDLFTGWMVRAAQANRSFYPGPVLFAEGLGRPLWQMAVPLRDQERQPFALLTAQVDLAFLADLAGKTRLGQGTHLMVVDEEGVIIGHPRLSLIAAQANASRANPAVPAVLHGQEGVEELRVGGIPHFVAYRALKTLDQNSLPGWGVLVLAPVAEVLPSGLASILVAVAVAAGGLFILLYVSTMVLAWVEDEYGG
ncbi:MAG: hypothetical protein OZSIB_1207 [Candidatus Ozemobacter sibiricus]|jgi:hypothetical protein|uniref:Cache domain-containing protein n=1 Tax=Candidatus Ozemobacter sibiricus TaxID=2268124 RepID=A0A367ZKV6_9BACT|nr:MAG: hypothetical protein OZSIB_1207 [Candidatus Ozemobacter sibiricus]